MNPNIKKPKTEYRKGVEKIIKRYKTTNPNTDEIIKAISRLYDNLYTIIKKDNPTYLIIKKVESKKVERKTY
jgi:hypothetical protein